jgi:hypothetical protein
MEADIMNDHQRIQALRDFIRHKDASIKRSERDYGSGVRSSAASADLATDRVSLKRAMLELSKLEGKQ